MNTDIKQMYPFSTRETNEEKAALAPQNIEAWRNFSRTVFKASALDEKTKQLIAVAVAHTTQCPYCIRAHVRGALNKGATKQEIMEAIWVAAGGRAGGAYSHANIAMEVINEDVKN